jgi:hypothetical protein
MADKRQGLFGAPPEPTIWRGISLSFIRQVLGQRARYPDCTTAMSDSDLHGPDEEPPVGALCWYATPHPHGNVSLYLGDRLCLCVGVLGIPDIIGYRSPVLGTYVGWSRSLGSTKEQT